MTNLEKIFSALSDALHHLSNVIEDLLSSDNKTGYNYKTLYKKYNMKKF